MRPQTRKRLSAIAFIVLVAAWPLVIAFAIARSEFSAETAPARVVFFLLTGLIWLGLAMQMIRLMQRELTEALEQRTATAEILRVISTSPTDAQPVFETIVKNAVSLSGSLFANVFRFDGELLHFAATHNVGPGYLELLRSKYPMRPDASQVSGRVILGKSIVRIEDVLTDPRYDQRFPAKMGWRRMLGVPMLRDGNPIGVIVVGWAESGPVPRGQEELLKIFADQAVIAIENARLFDEVQARNRELRIALDQQTATSELLSVIGRSTFDLEPVFDTLAENAIRLCGADRALIFRSDGELLQVAAAYNISPELRAFHERNPIAPGRGSCVGRMALERRTVHIHDVRTDSEYTFGGQHVDPYRTLLAVPMLKAGELLGAINIVRYEVLPFTEQQIALMESFADQAVIAVENARLFDEVQARTRELSEALEQQIATADVLKVISRSAFDLQTVFDTLVEAAARLCEADNSWLFRRDGDVFRWAASYGYSEERMEPIREYFQKAEVRPGRGSLTGRTALEGRPVQIPDVFADPEYEWHEAQQLSGFRTTMGIPLLRDGAVVGVFVVTRSEVRPFNHRHISLLTTFADQAVIAIENARLFDEVQARTRELSEALEYQTATGDVLKVISRSAFDLQAVLNTLAEAAVRLCGADAGAIARQKGEIYYQVAHFGAPPDYEDFIKGLPLSPGRGSIVGRVLLERHAVQIPDVLEDSEYAMSEIQKATGFRTLLGVPLLREDNPIGVFVLWRRSVSVFSDKQIELLTTFADQAVIAIENARLFDEIQDKSRQLEIANKYKSHFIASASHDLRQPLHALNLFVAQMRAEFDPKERERLAGRIEAAVGSMNELFAALLDMTKLDAGILEPHVTEVSIARLFQRIETTFAEAAHVKGLRLRIVASSAWVHSDAILLERILLNLVSNAVRYTTHGGVVIGCRHISENVRIDICDSGPGIPEDQQQSIFSEFYQVSGHERGGQVGFGLGLAIVERLGRLLGHVVELKSRPGRGSRFSISVPVVAGRREIGGVSAADTTIADPARGKLVVVIDDDPLVLDGMGGILDSWGCKVVAAETAEAVLAKTASRQPDLIISDYRLRNGETGINAIHRIREALRSPTPAFLISGDTAPERLRDASDHGFHLLHKPVPPMRLRAMVNQLLRDRPTAIAPAAE
jgi:GAF domain-containing protein/CheY-like chemotaxis protein